MDTYRRGNGEGSVFKREDGRWVAKLQIGTNENGKPIMKSFYAQKRADAVKRMNEYQYNLKQGVKLVKKLAMDEYLLTWLRNKKLGKMKPASYDRLESTIKNNINPRIGFYNLQDLTGPIIQAELIDDMQHGNEELNLKPYSYSVIKKAYNALDSCLKYAVANRHIVFNYMETVDLPSQTLFAKKEIKFLSEAEITKLRSNLQNESYPFYYRLVLCFYALYWVKNGGGFGTPLV